MIQNSMIFSIADKLENVRARIQKATISAKRFPGSVQLLAVTKTREAEILHQAMQAGLVQFGENYLSEALAKQKTLLSLCGEEDYAKLVWHFIGPIQSNKTRLIAENFSWVHTLERSKIVQRLNEQRPTQMQPLNCCIQINIDEENSKSGILLKEVEPLAAEINSAPNLCLRGLMCIPNANQSEANLMDAFNRMAKKFEELKALYPSVDTLSMGMSSDIETAIECGSSMVRVGTALFGERT
jgi:pyridoxal phosphate enzyme (YggS family)